MYVVFVRDVKNIHMRRKINSFLIGRNKRDPVYPVPRPSIF